MLSQISISGLKMIDDTYFCIHLRTFAPQLPSAAVQSIDSPGSEIERRRNCYSSNGKTYIQDL